MTRTPFRRGDLFLLTLAGVLAFSAAAWLAQAQTPAPATSCDVTSDVVDARRYVLSGPTCPIAGTLIVYTQREAAPDGTPIEIPESTIWRFAAGAITRGSSAGVFYPVGREPGR